VRQWRPSAKVNEHKEARSLERLVDMEVSRKKIRFRIFGESRGGEAHFLTTKVYQSNHYTVNKIQVTGMQWRSRQDAVL
jgi:hypothetical protein